ncbi:MAG: 4a-hydroxytetrahydrobiopterin dehydratase [Noviherbaspirillum sp.]
MITADALLKKHSRHQDTALPDADLASWLAALDGWALQDGRLVKTYAFKDYYRTMAFVNAIAWLSHAEDHHPDLTVGYNRCVVNYRTHSVNSGQGGLSENDFICAAKVDALALQAPGVR